MKDFFEVQSQIQKLLAEIAGSSEQVQNPVVDESDLTLQKLDEYNAQLQDLQKEKVAVWLIINQLLAMLFYFSQHSAVIIFFQNLFNYSCRVRGCTRFLNL